MSICWLNNALSPYYIYILMLCCIYIFNLSNIYMIIPIIGIIMTYNNKETFSITDGHIANKIDMRLNPDLYSDIDEVFEKKNMSRLEQYNIINDQEAFGLWCHDFLPTCKTNQERCIRFEDIRMKY